MKLTGFEKLAFVSSFVWLMHWGSCLSSKLVEMVLFTTSVRMLPGGF